MNEELGAQNVHQSLVMKRAIPIELCFVTKLSHRFWAKKSLVMIVRIPLPRPSGQGHKLVERISVARVQPRTSKGITDLLLPQTSLR